MMGKAFGPMQLGFASGHIAFLRSRGLEGGGIIYQ